MGMTSSVDITAGLSDLALLKVSQPKKNMTHAHICLLISPSAACPHHVLCY